MRLTDNPALHYDSYQLDEYADMIKELTTYYGDGANIVLAAMIKAGYVDEQGVRCPNFDQTMLCPGCRTTVEAVEYLVNDGVLELGPEDDYESEAYDLSRYFTWTRIEDNYVLFAD
jgi:hypothetical protein